MVFDDVFDDICVEQPEFIPCTPETIPRALMLLPSAAGTGRLVLRHAGLELEVFQYCLPIHEYMRSACPY